MDLGDIVGRLHQDADYGHQNAGLLRVPERTSFVLPATRAQSASSLQWIGCKNRPNATRFSRKKFRISASGTPLNSVLPSHALDSAVDRHKSASNGYSMKEAFEIAEYLRNGPAHNANKLELINSIMKVQDAEESNTTSSEAVYLVDLDNVTQRLKLFKTLFPDVEPFYAVKCNPDQQVLHTLCKMGCGFEVSSASELDLVHNTYSRIDESEPGRILFSNPIKTRAAISKALRMGEVLTMVFDTEDELGKISDEIQEAAQEVSTLSNIKLLIRIQAHVLPHDSSASMNCKFGASLDQVHSLLVLANSLGLTVSGVAFHVGSETTLPIPFCETIRNASQVFTFAEQLGLPRMSILDIGGGFPAWDVHQMQSLSHPINTTLRECFDLSSIKVFAEPGRFLVEPSHWLATRILCVKRFHDSISAAPLHSKGHFVVCSSSYHYYLGDGVYGSFKDSALMNRGFEPFAFRRRRLDQTAETRSDEPVFCSVLFGPTCDPLDCIANNIALPELERGDWLVFQNMGAYTRSLACSFNGIPFAKPYYLETATD